MKRGFFSFWWCIALAMLAWVCLYASIIEGDIAWIWINSIVGGLWLFYAWREKKIDALEAEAGETDDRSKD